MQHSQLLKETDRSERGKKTEEEQMDDVVIVFFMCSLSSTQNHKSKKKNFLNFCVYLEPIRIYSFAEHSECSSVCLCLLRSLFPCSKMVYSSSKIKLGYILWYSPTQRILKPFLFVPWSEDQRTRNWWPEVVRLKGVGRSPLSVARVGLLAVGPGKG